VICGVGVALALAVAACEAEPEPLFGATCAPDASMEGVTCTIRNHGKKASRACFRARVQPETGDPIIARRICTKVLGPEQSAEVPAQFEKIGGIEPSSQLVTQCMKYGQWTCKVDVVETSREMSENQPKAR
jgi:hypothetical protein